VKASIWNTWTVRFGIEVSPKGKSPSLPSRPMEQLTRQIAAAWAATTPVEAVAAALGLVYLVLVIRQHALCWVAAFISTVLYAWVFWRADLRMQAALQVYYVAMAVYGWVAWRGGRERPGLAVTRGSWRLYAGGLAGVLAATAVTVATLGIGADPARALLDAFTTWASVFTTWLVARKILGNWGWWLGIDALIAVLCWQQQLYATALLYALYLVLVVIGWRAWYADWRRGPAAPA
jgi:nicotinamide mononucleotide transporter